MLAITHQPICPLQKTCFYPNIKSQLFLRYGEPCNNGYRCAVELGMNESHLIAAIEMADQAEHNTKRSLRDWDCGCRACRLGVEGREFCYSLRGPDRDLRKVFWERRHRAEFKAARNHQRLRPDPKTDLRVPLRHLPLFPDDQGQEILLSPSALPVQ